jgi:hypothetical protein
MPLYEYVCQQDGTVIELIRPMASADDPVEDPEGNGRAFTRKHSTFGTRAGSDRSTGASLPVGGCCPCGKNMGSCGSRG